MSVSQIYNVILVGAAGCGKTSLLRRQESGNFDPRYLATDGMTITDFNFFTNYGKITLSVRDCPGDAKFRGLDSCNYQGAQACVVMFDLTSEHCCSTWSNWVKDVKYVCPNIPILLCGSKIDMPKSSVPLRKSSIKSLVDGYCEISTLNAYNFEEPFLIMMRMLTHHDDLKLVDASQH